MLTFLAIPPSKWMTPDYRTPPMSSAFHRRDFLRHSSYLLAGGAAAGMLGRAIAAEKSTRLTLACGDATLRHVKAVDCWAALKAVGAQGV